MWEIRKRFRLLWQQGRRERRACNFLQDRGSGYSLLAHASEPEAIIHRLVHPAASLRKYCKFPRQKSTFSCSKDCQVFAGAVAILLATYIDLWGGG